MHKVLIVDDEKPAREFIADLVAFYLPDSEITKADHPLKALAYLRKEPFDLLFIDIRMPDMTGLEMLELIGQKERKPFTVIVSAHREFDYAIKGMELGAAAYITKPLHREKMHQAIRLYLKWIKKNTIDIKIPTGMLRIEMDNILAIQIVDRARVKIYTSQGVIPSASGTLSTLHPLLPPYFYYIRRDCILNFHAIKHYSLKCSEVVIACGYEMVALTVSRENKNALIDWQNNTQ